MARKRLIPFRMLPGSWGLKGKSFDKAKAEYELDGHELSVKLAEIQYGVDSKEAKTNSLRKQYADNAITQYELDKKLLELQYSENPEQLAIETLKNNLKHDKIEKYFYDKAMIPLVIKNDEDEKQKALLKVDLNYDKIDQYEYQKRLVQITYKDDEKGRNLQLLEIELKNHRLSDNEYKKQKSTLNNEPWVAVVDIKINKDNPTGGGEYELDWNEPFIVELKKAGFNGPTDYIVVEKWFNLLCAAIAAENGIVNATDNLPGEGGLDLGDGRKAYS